MDSLIVCILSLFLILLLTAVGVLYAGYRKAVKDKNNSIVKWIHERDQMMRELDRMMIEKELLERVVASTGCRESRLKGDADAIPPGGDLQEIVFTGRAHIVKSS